MVRRLFVKAKALNKGVEKVLGLLDMPVAGDDAPVINADAVP